MKLAALGSAVLVAVFVIANCVGCAAPVEAPQAVPVPVTVHALPTYYTVAIDPGLAAADILIALEALAEWQSTVPVKFDTHVAVCTDEAICIYDGPSHVSGTELLTVTGSYGQCNWTVFGEGGTVQLNETEAQAGPRMFKSLVMHEVGHAVGFAHHDGRNIMNTSPLALDAPSADDVAQWVTRGTSNAEVTNGY